MKIIKLAFISLVAFGLLLWAFTLLFPSNTVISRAANMAGRADSLFVKVKRNEISMQHLLAPNNDGLLIQAADIPFYENNLFNPLSGSSVPKADTIFFRVVERNKSVAEGGIAFYQLAEDSATTQLFYVFQTQWYHPLRKMKMIVADKVYGPSLDSTLQRFKLSVQ